MKRFSLLVLVAVVVVGASALAAGETLKFITNHELEDREMEYVEAFEDEYGCDIEIEVIGHWSGKSILPARFAAGEGPDVCFFPHFDALEFASNGWMLPLDDYLDPYAEPFSVATSNTFEFFGKHYGVGPYEWSLILMYNRSLFEMYGLDTPKEMWEEDEWTWEEWINISKSLTMDLDGDGAADQFGCTLVWMPCMELMGSNGVTAFKMVDGRPVYDMDSAESIEALETWIDYEKEEWGMPEPHMDVSVQRMLDGQLAMLYGPPTWSDAAAIFAEEWGDDFEFAPMPKGPNGENRDLLNLTGWFVGSGTANPELATAFLTTVVEMVQNYPMYEEYQDILGDERYEQLIGQTENGVWPNLYWWLGRLVPSYGWREALIDEGQSPAQFVEEVEGQYQAVIDELWAAFQVQ